jgi:transcription antitermination factor NusG
MSSKSQQFNSCWYIFYTYPRAEKIAYQELLKRNYDVFLPMTKVLSIWKNRQKKWIDRVLFPNYIFINTKLNELYDITKVPKIVSYIHCAGKPSIISFQEIEGIKKILGLEQEVIVETSFFEGERVEIVHGPLLGYEGVLIEQKGKTRFGIQLKEINQSIFIDISTSMLKKLT